MNLRVSDLSYTYPTGVTALRGVSLEIGPGESVAIVGQNGAGKTTLVKHLNGLLRPTAGAVYVDGADTAARHIAQLATTVGYVFQNPDDQLFQRTVRDEVAFGPRCLAWPPDQVASAVADALATTGLVEQAPRHPYDLGLAQRKRVALAAVLAMHTPILVLDEPTTGQDARGIELVGGIVDALRRGGRTIITVTHDIDFCAEHFGRVVVMAEGRILADGPAAQVLPDHATLAASDVEAPQMVRLAARLQWTAGQAPLTVDEFVAGWRAQR
jgi:energy-coupling factor transport system ATP-binding protein